MHEKVADETATMTDGKGVLNVLLVGGGSCIIDNKRLA
jgi:hypothetical protein